MPDDECCNAIVSANRQAIGTPARQALCECYKDAVKSTPYRKIINFPEICHIPQAVPISPLPTKRKKNEEKKLDRAKKRAKRAGRLDERNQVRSAQSASRPSSTSWTDCQSAQLRWVECSAVELVGRAWGWLRVDGWIRQFDHRILKIDPNMVEQREKEKRTATGTPERTSKIIAVWLDRGMADPDGSVSKTD
ncbi:hypothetical protein F2Q69_00024720 [Brassica cretica]|uniref:Bifunctional inhibitor/plant lipid transfer protein/seed storage helical domain-containing protein n=1 Tax=Brassica cretica TaxID=69181 RepID=A0A8S9QGT2_BRACR|nr:hypothetical protein F2Q69_00024720 [Brassica cretica]